MRAEANYARRRRTAGASLLCAAAAAVAAILLLGGGGGGAPAPAAKPPTRPRVLVRTGPRGTESVPILMYHVILAAPAGAPFPGLYITPVLFAAQSSEAPAVRRRRA